jgi:hypothetical protein
VSDGTGRTAAEAVPGEGRLGRRPPEDETTGQDEQGGRGGRERGWRLALVGLVGAFVVLGGYGLFSVAASGQFTASGSAAAKTIPAAIQPARAAAPAGTVIPASSATHVLPVAAVAAFGPAGTADGDNPAIVSRVNSGGTQPWYSSWYVTPEFGGLQAGTGLLLDMGAAVSVDRVRLVLGTKLGADVQIRVGNSPALAGLATVASSRDARGTVGLTPATPASGRYVLVWFFRLPPNADGQYQVDVYDVTVDGTE